MYWPRQRKGLCGRVSLCAMRKKYMSACSGKFAGGFLNSGKPCKCIWKTQHETENKEMYTLSKTSLPFVIKSGQAVTINNKNYRGWNWKNCIDWRRIKQRLISSHADSFYLTIYLNHKLFVSCAKVSIITAYYGIRCGYHVVRLNSANGNPFIQLVFEGCQRLGKTETFKKQTITSEILVFRI